MLSEQLVSPMPLIISIAAVGLPLLALIWHLGRVAGIRRQHKRCEVHHLNRLLDAEVRKGREQ